MNRAMDCCCLKCGSSSIMKRVEGGKEEEAPVGRDGQWK